MRQTWQQTLAWATATSTPVASTVTETILVPDTTIGGNLLSDGAAIRVRGFGSYGTTSPAPTAIFAVRWGGVSGTVLAKTATNTLTVSFGGGASMTALWAYEFIIQTRTNGSSGTLMTNGVITMFSATAAAGGTIANYGMPVPLVSGTTGGSTPVASAAVNLTADTALSFAVTWGAASAANSIQVLQHYVEHIN